MKYRTTIEFNNGYCSKQITTKTKPRTETNVFVVNEGRKRIIYPLVNVMAIEVEEIEEEKD